MHPVLVFLVAELADLVVPCPRFVRQGVVPCVDVVAHEIGLELVVGRSIVVSD
jgi:hypothetical protein